MGIPGPGMEPTPTGGAILLTVAVTATPRMAVDVAKRLAMQGQDVAELRRAIEWAQDNPDEALEFLPLKDFPLARFDPVRDTWNLRLDPPTDTEKARRERFENVHVPCFYACGRYDIIEWPTFESFRAMQTRGGTPDAQRNQHIVVGPWTHDSVPAQFLGEVNFGPGANPAGAQLTAQTLGFCDRYLRGIDVRVPTVHYFTMGRNRWQTANDWSLPQTTWQRYFLHSRGSANTASGDGLLSRDEPFADTPMNTSTIRMILHPLSVGE